MSPEVWSKYSPSTETTTTAAKQESGNDDGIGTTTMENEEKPSSTDDKLPEGITEDTQHKPSDTTEAAVEDS